MRAYRNALTLVFKFLSEQNGSGAVCVQLADLEAKGEPISMTGTDVNMSAH
jgi:hypothetical protein